MNRIILRLLSAQFLSILAVFVTGTALSHAQTVLSASSILPTNHFQTRSALVDWGVDVERVTQGRVKVNLLPKAVVAPPGTLDAVRDGLVDVAWTVHGLTSARFVLTKIAELPGNGDSAEQTSVAFQRIHDRYLAKAGEHKGVKVIAVFTHGPGQILMARRPINSIEDLAGTKFRSPGGIAVEVAKSLGATGIVTPVTEIYEILSGGIVDGVFFDFSTIASLKLEQLIKYVTIVPGGLYNSSFVVVMNEDRFNKLSKQDRDAIDSVSGEVVSRRVGRTFDAQEKISVAALTANNVAVTTASPAFMQALKAKTAGIEAKWIKEANAKGLDGAKVLAEFRAEIPKVRRTPKD